MTWTLLLIYSIGLGNKAIFTEKFNSYDTCLSVGQQVMQHSDVIYSSCTRDSTLTRDVQVEEIKTNR